MALLANLEKLTLIRGFKNKTWLDYRDARAFGKLLASLPKLESLTLHPAPFLDKQNLELLSSSGTIKELDFSSTLDAETLVSQVITFKSLHKLKLLVENHDEDTVSWMKSKINASNMPHLEAWAVQVPFRMGIK